MNEKVILRCNLLQRNTFAVHHLKKKTYRCIVLLSQLRFDYIARTTDPEMKRANKHFPKKGTQTVVIISVFQTFQHMKHEFRAHVGNTEL